MRNATYFKIFVAFSIIYLIALFLGYQNLDLFLKPVLIPLLGFGVYFYRPFPSKRVLLTALLFSWIGDVVLLFADIGEIYFILGLVAFLISHITYCVLFNKQNTGEIQINKVFFAIGSLLYCILLNWNGAFFNAQLRRFKNTCNYLRCRNFDNAFICF